MKQKDIGELLFQGRLALSRKDHGAARHLFTEALGWDPACSEALLGMGLVQSGEGDPAEALVLISRAIESDSTNMPAWLQLGYALLRTGKLPESRAAFEQAHSLAPRSADTCHGLGLYREQAGDRNGAVQWYTRAVSLKENSAVSWYRLGMIHTHRGMLDRALPCLRHALREEPTNGEYLLAYAELLWGAGRLVSGMEIMDRLVGLYPTESRYRSTRIMSLGYLTSITHRQLFTESTSWEHFHAFGVKQFPVSGPRRDAGRRRIGYVSPDFHSHSVGMLIQAVIRHHDRERFDVFCYYCGTRNDRTTEEIRTSCDGWKDISRLHDDEAAQLIHDDGIDILIDLAGHTAGNRLGIFAHRPAPVQLSWLGYPHTTGLRAIDWFIADRVSVPEGEDSFFTESVLHLPHFRVPFSPPELSPEVLPPPCADNGYVTFGSFNNVAKLNEEVITAWSAVLKAVPGSRLLLKWKTMNSRSVRQRYRRLFARNGISPERIEFRDESSYYMMMIEYGDVDIALDPFPYSGCLTTYQALWMGVPVVTLRGETPVGRQSAAILEELGLADLVADSVDAYVRTAINLAAAPRRLDGLRSTLRQTLDGSRLVDFHIFTFSLETAYQYSYDATMSGNLRRGGPSDLEPLEAAAKTCYEANQPSRALEIIQALGKRGEGRLRLQELAARIAVGRGRGGRAFKLFESAALDCADSSALLALGWMYGKKMHRYTDAIATYRKLLALQPNSGISHFCLGGLLIETGKGEEGIGHLKQVVQLDRYSRTGICGYLFGINYSDRINPRQLFEEHRLCCANFVAKAGRKFTSWGNSVETGRRLKIGYVSADFGAHPVTYFLLHVFANHNREDFELYCYSNRSVDDNLTCYFREQSDHWRPIWNVDTHDVTSMIRRDGIDILVDLSGHTKDNRMDVFARKPAPLQVSWLGYPNTTGLPSMDFRITDAIADPPGIADELHTERLLRLPGTFLCFYPPPDAPAITKRGCPSQRNGFVTFGSFNNLSKISSTTLELWARTLVELPGSKLLIKRDALADAGVRGYFEDTFERFGVEKDRLILRHSSDMSKHVSQYQEIDIALDTFPYNGTTTTCEALWMGVPVVTLRGDRHAARVSASILSIIGLDDLVAATGDEYVAKAVAIACDVHFRQKLRHELRGMISNSLLGDGSAFTKNLECTYRSIWTEWCNSRFQNSQELPK